MRAGLRRTRRGALAVAALAMTASAAFPGSIPDRSEDPRPNVIVILTDDQSIETLPHSSDAVWEYTYRDAQARALRAQEQAVVRAGRTYVISWQTPRDAWAANLPALGVVLDTFRPPPGP